MERRGRGGGVQEGKPSGLQNQKHPKPDYSLIPASLEGNKLSSAAEWNECVNTFVVEGEKQAKKRHTGRS